MAKDLFHNSTSTIPKDDPKVNRIEFDKSDLGARKSHLKAIRRADNPHKISHVGKG